MSVIGVVEFKFDLLKSSTWMISMSKSVKTDFDHFSTQKNKCFCLSVSKMKRVWHLRKAFHLYDSFVLWHIWKCLWICSWGIPQPKTSCIKGLCCWTKSTISYSQTDWGNLTLSEQPNEGAFHYFMVPPKLGKVMNWFKNHLPDWRTEPFWNK